MIHHDTWKLRSWLCIQVWIIPAATIIEELVIQKGQIRSRQCNFFKNYDISHSKPHEDTFCVKPWFWSWFQLWNETPHSHSFITKSTYSPVLHDLCLVITNLENAFEDYLSSNAGLVRRSSVRCWWEQRRENVSAVGLTKSVGVHFCILQVKLSKIVCKEFSVIFGRITTAYFCKLETSNYAWTDLSNCGDM